MDKTPCIPASQCSLTLTKLLADEGFEVDWRFSGAAALKDRQVVEDTFEHYAVVTVPLGFHELSPMGRSWNIPSAFKMHIRH